MTVTRDGWEQTASVSVSRNAITTNKTEFPYALLAIESTPSGLTATVAGTNVGKTPISLTLKPGTYDLMVTDGENDLPREINIGPWEQSTNYFIFRYGAVQLLSTPTGATVIRKGKQVGKTPLTLTNMPIFETKLELQLDGYAATNLTISAPEEATAARKQNCSSTNKTGSWWGLNSTSRLIKQVRLG